VRKRELAGIIVFELFSPKIKILFERGKSAHFKAFFIDCVLTGELLIFFP